MIILKRRMVKCLAVWVMICFMTTMASAQSVSHPTVQTNTLRNSQAAAFKTPIKKLNIPSELGEIDTLFLPQAKTNAPFFIHIQDAHAHELTQTRIKELLRFLKSDYGVRLFGFEGAHKRLDPGVLHFVPDSRTNLKVADYLLRKGILSGGEFFALEETEKNGKTLSQEKGNFEGIEDARIYLRDLMLFRRGLANKSNMAPILDALRAQIGRLKSKSYNRELAKFDRMYQEFMNRDEKDVLGFFRELEARAKNVLGMDLSEIKFQKDFPQLLRLRHLLATDESRLNPAQIKSDIEKLIHFLKTKSGKNLDRNPLFDLMGKMIPSEEKAIARKPLTTWREYFESVHAWMLRYGVSWAGFPYLKTYAKRMILEEELASESLFSELETLTWRVLERLAVSEFEKNLVSLEQQFLDLEKILKLEANRDEVRRAQAKGNLHLETVLSGLAGLERDRPPISRDEASALKSQYQLAMQFYRNSVEREQVFVNRLLELAGTYRANRLVFVTGGYHTQGICEELKRRGIGYLSIRPRNYSLDQENLKDRVTNLYEEVMLGKGQALVMKSHIPTERFQDPEMVFESGPVRRQYSVALAEALDKTGSLADLVRFIQASSEEALSEQEIAERLQGILARNPYLEGERVQVEVATLEKKGKALRVSGDNFRQGVLVRIPRVMVSAASVTDEREIRTVSAQSLGFWTRRELLDAFKRVVEGAVLAAAVGGCAQSQKPKQMPGVVLGEISPSSSGTITQLPQNNHQNKQNQPEPQNLFAFLNQGEEGVVTGTTIEGDPSTNQIAGVKTPGIKTTYDISNPDISKAQNPAEPNVYAGAGVSADNFGTAKPNVETTDMSKISGGQIVIYAKGDPPELLVTIKGFSKSNPTVERNDQYILERTDVGGFYTIPLNGAPDADMDISRIIEISVVVNPDRAGSVKRGTFTVVFGGITPPGIPVFVDTSNPVSESQTSDFSNQPTTQGNKFPQDVTANVTGGSTKDTTVFGEKDNSILFKFAHAKDGEYSGVTFSRDNSNDGGDKTQKILDDFIDMSNLRELVMNLESLSGNFPRELVLEMEDEKGNRLVFRVFEKDTNGKTVAYSGKKATLRIAFDAVNIPDTFNLKKVAFINLVSTQPFKDATAYRGLMRVTVQGVSLLYEEDARQGSLALAQTSDFAKPVTRPRALPTLAQLTAVPGATAQTSIQFLDPVNGLSQINYHAVSGAYSGISISADDNDGNFTIEDLMDFTTFFQQGGLSFNLEFLQNAAIPDSTIVEIVSLDQNQKEIRYRVKIQKLAIGQNIVMVPLIADRFPKGFDIARIKAFNVIFSAPNVPQGQTPIVQSGKARIQFRGYEAKFDVSVGKAHEDRDITEFSKIRGISGNVSFNPVNSGFSRVDPIKFDLSIQLSPPTSAGQNESGVDILPPSGQAFDLTSIDSLKFNYQQMAGQLGELPKDGFLVRLTDGSGKTHVIALPFIKGNKIPGDKLGYTVFVNDSAIPSGSINKNDIRGIRIMFIERFGDSGTYSGTVELTAKSLGFTVRPRPVPSILISEMQFNGPLFASFAVQVPEGILAPLPRLSIRFPRMSEGALRGEYDALMNQIMAQVLAGQPDIGIPQMTEALARLSHDPQIRREMREGYGLELELLGDRIPTEADIQSLLVNLRLHPQIFIRWIYTGENPEALKPIIERVKTQRDLSGREFGIRFGVAAAQPYDLRMELRKTLVSVFNLMNKFGNEFGIKEKPKNSIELQSHTVILGSESLMEAVNLLLVDAIEITNDIPGEDPERDSHLAYVRLLGARFAVKSAKGLSLEEKQALAHRQLSASYLLSGQFEVLEKQIKAALAVMIAA